MTAIRVLLLLALAALAAACATQKPRFGTEGINTQLTPRQVTERTGAAVGQPVLWGGVIVNSSNLTDATQLEILAYPLDSEQRPNTDRGPIGRFLAVKPGYLETADFAPGREITVSGVVTEAATGKIGEASYTYPVVRIDDAQLWQRQQYRASPQPRVNFGIGVMIGR